MLIKKRSRKKSSRDADALRESICKIASQSWRYKQVLSKALQCMDPTNAERFSRQYSYFARRVERAIAATGLKKADYTDRPNDVRLQAQAMEPKAFDADVMRISIAEIAAESWRYEQALSKAIRRMDPMDAERFYSQYSYFARQVKQAVDEAGLRVVDYAGQPYDVGLPVQAMNLEDFDEDEALIIAQTVEPVIMSEGRVIKTGMVMLDRVRDAGKGEE